MGASVLKTQGRFFPNLILNLVSGGIFIYTTRVQKFHLSPASKPRSNPDHHLKCLNKLCNQFSVEHSLLIRWTATGFQLNTETFNKVDRHFPHRTKTSLRWMCLKQIEHLKPDGRSTITHLLQPIDGHSTCTGREIMWVVSNLPDIMCMYIQDWSCIIETIKR